MDQIFNYHMYVKCMYGLLARYIIFQSVQNDFGLAEYLWSFNRVMTQVTPDSL